MSKQEIRKRVGAFIIQDKKLLLVSGQNIPIFWSPGGKIDEGESLEDCLRRELLEELQVGIKSLKFYDHIKIEAAKFGDVNFNPSDNHYYLVEVSGEIKPSSEIDIIRWFSKEDIKDPMLQPAYRDIIFPKLIKDGLI